MHSHVTINRGVSLRKIQGVSTLVQLTPESLDNFVNDAHAELFFNLVPSLLPPPVRGCRPGKIVQMTEAEVRGLCIKSREIFLSQPILLELEAPLKICGQ